MKVTSITAGFMIGIIGLVLSTVAVAQFKEKSAAFDVPGVGDPTREYTCNLPAGITLETPTGEIIEGGDVVCIPGKFIRLVGAEEAEKIIAAGQAFKDKTQLAEIMAKKDKFSMIELTLPEGYTATHRDGRVIKGPGSINLLVEAISLKRSEPLAEPPSLLRSGGFTQK